MHKFLTVAIFVLMSQQAYAGMQSKGDFLKALCEGKHVESDSIESIPIKKNYQSALEIFSKMKPLEVHSCNVRDDGYIDYLIEKYTNVF